MRLPRQRFLRLDRVIFAIGWIMLIGAAVPALAPTAGSRLAAVLNMFTKSAAHEVVSAPTETLSLARD